ncbi:MAG: DUF6488 family protein [Gammaproteobacteria bacterium]
MYRSRIVLLFLLNMIVMTSLAQSGGHYHGPRISEDEAKVTAREIVNDLIEDNKIDAGWQMIEPGSVSQRTFDGHLEWVVTFRNDAIEDETRRTLYIFLTLGGEYTGANYTGE